ncbi:MAG: hypothetical protein RL154_674 [Pseudomonadota bacterium]|jgi:ADP-heptose:LPS heptosyltransferase
MLKLLFKNRIQNNIARQIANVPNAPRYLIAVFSRYGDGIIAFKIASEFAKAHKNSKFLVVTTHQLLPYAQEFFGKKAMAVNKRNPFELYKTVVRIKNFAPDIGLNPWSFGDEARFFISYATNFVDFSAFKTWNKIDNLYDRAREYFGLALPERLYTPNALPENANVILFAPFSTDVTKSLSQEKAVEALANLNAQYPNAIIWLCGFKNETAKLNHANVFNFQRSTISSSYFLNLLKSSDLFVGVDAGPLHLATSLDIASLAIFGPTAPQTILDSYNNVTVWRDSKLDDIFCFVESCKNPVCLQDCFKTSEVLPQSVRLESTNCPMIEK